MRMPMRNSRHAELHLVEHHPVAVDHRDRDGRERRMPGDDAVEDANLFHQHANAIGIPARHADGLPSCYGAQGEIDPLLCLIAIHAGDGYASMRSCQ